MFGARRSQRDVEEGTYRRMHRAPGKEEAIQMYITDELLLAHYEEGCSRICKEVPWLPSAS